MNDKAERVLAAIGKEKSYFEALSCAFEGMDKIYTFNGFELKTYQLKNIEYVNSVLFLDDTVQTEERVYIGMTKDDVVSKYGSDYSKSLNKLRYRKGDSLINFIFENDMLVSVE